MPRHASALVLLASLAGCAARPPCPPPPACPSAPAPARPPASASAPAPPPATRSPAPPPAPRRRPTAKLFDDGLEEAGFFPRGDAFELGLDGQALDTLLAEAEKTRSDALIVLADGRVVAERYFGQKRGPIETMSITKSITALAVVLLLEAGKLRSLDAPLSELLPEFARGKKAAITLRHLLTHTSGLAHGKDARALNAQKDRTAYARRAALVDEPGTVFSYNNEATQLLTLVIEKAAGKQVDAYLDEVLFRPLGIRGWQWDRDAGDHVQTYYGLALAARDLARIGQMLLDGGRAGGRQILSPQGVASLHAPSERNPYHGLLWWIRYDRVVHELEPSARVDGVDLTPLAGRPHTRAEAFWLDAGARLSPAEREAVTQFVSAGGKLVRERPDRAIGFHADGSLGQRLAIFPEQRLVVVRQRRRRPPAEESEALSFPGLLELSAALRPAR